MHVLLPDTSLALSQGLAKKAMAELEVAGCVCPAPGGQLGAGKIALAELEDCILVCVPGPVVVG